MKTTADLLREAYERLLKGVVDDVRWDGADELLQQVAWFTLFGYAAGGGQLICCLDDGVGGLRCGVRRAGV